MNTNKKIDIITRLLNSTDTCLEDVYKSYSNSKYRAYKKCKELQQLDNGYNFRILSANTFQFTCAYIFEKDGYKFIKCMTKDNIYEFEFDIIMGEHF